MNFLSAEQAWRYCLSLQRMANEGTLSRAYAEGMMDAYFARLESILAQQGGGNVDAQQRP